MIKILKIWMIVWSVIGILFGLAFIFIPKQLGAMYGFEDGPMWTGYIYALLGIAWIVLCVFIIIAARDPLKNILWVQCAIAWAILNVFGYVYAVICGFVTFPQVWRALAIDGVSAIAFLILYPWRAANK